MTTTIDAAFHALNPQKLYRMIETFNECTANSVVMLGNPAFKIGCLGSFSRRRNQVWAAV